jgi:cobalt transporter subunit CbtB
MQTRSPVATQRDRPASLAAHRIAPALAGALGLFLIWGVGFWQIDAVHNAAHDARHANAFPCH